MDRGRIRRAHSSAGDAREAAREFHDSVIQPDMSLVVFFASADYDLGVLAEELRLLFEGIQLVGLHDRR